MEGHESTLATGTRLDRYELLCPIATGGMASVWLARLRGKRGFEKLFAIKTIKTELISDANFQEMFLDEARIASRIVHPNVAQILELGEQNDILYLVMEFVDGDSVAKVARLAAKKQNPLPPGVSLRIVADMCAGLHAAHQLRDPSGELLGVVHRDVSPQNTLIAVSGQSKIIDFGLVKAKNRSAAQTESGVVKGKIRYMAPEQVGSRPIDHRADVWAAGMCLYELITGHPPYHGEDDLDVVKRLMSPNPLPRFEVALPPPIELILTHAIVADPAGRFPSCQTMRRAIERAIHDLAVPAETEDVADFLRDVLPELAAKRAKTIQKASAVADALPTGDSVPPPKGSDTDLEPGDIAFAATEVSGRDKRGKSRPGVEDSASAALPLTRRLEVESGSEPRIASSMSGRTPSAQTLREQLGETKKRGSAAYIAAAVVVAGAAAFILWPRGGGGVPTALEATTSSASSAPAASGAASASTTLPAAPPVDTTALPAPAESGGAPVELDPAAPALSLGAMPNPKASPPVVFPGPAGSRAAPRPSAVAIAPAVDGGLSPGARKMADLILVRPPTSASAPPPPPPPEPAP